MSEQEKENLEQPAATETTVNEPESETPQLEPQDQEAESASASEPSEPSAPEPQASAPASTSKAAQSDDDEDEEKEESFAELLEKYDTFREYRPGDIATGTVVSINERDVLLDIGARVEAMFPTSELTDASGNTIELKEHDRVEVMIDRFNPMSNTIPVSFERARVTKVWDDIESRFNEGQTVPGKVVEKVKGGFIVDIGVRAFLPTSLATLKPQRDYSDLLGESFDVQIVKMQRRRGNVILSRKEILQKEYEQSRSALMNVLEEGAVITGKVKSLTDYGCFVDLGGMDGLLHVTDMSWGRIEKPSDLVSIGQDLEVKVLRLDLESEKISLSLKHLKPDPWLSVEENYPIGTNVPGKVLNVVNYGAFVELEPGVEGLIHTSELSWTKQVRNPNQVIKPGLDVVVHIMGIDQENRRVSLSLRRTKDNPWESLGQRFPGGSRVKGVVRNITEFGAFVEIEEGIDGLVHVSDFAWGEKNANPHNFVKKGEEIEVYILSVDAEAQKVSLSIKKLSPDPWVEFLNDYKEGQVVKAPVCSVNEYGVEVKLTDHVLGFIRRQELNIGKSDRPEESVKEGDELKAMITRIHKRDKKVFLSVRRMVHEEERRNIEAYTKNQDQAGAKLGDLLKDLY
jgi:small subunit ribosomal protein S1